MPLQAIAQWPVQITWWEEPVIADNFDGYHKIAHAIRTSVVGGETYFTHRDLNPFSPVAKPRSFSRTSCVAGT